MRSTRRWTPDGLGDIESVSVTTLRPHPSTPEDAWAVSALAERTDGDDLRLRWVVRGALDGLRLSPPGPVRRGDHLWEHTCAEAFVRVEGAPAYVELNFAPSCEWAAYAFTAYRDGGPLAASGLAPVIDVRREPDALAFDVRVALDALSPTFCGAPLRVGLSVITEAADGHRAFFALHHPCPHPDFHHADGFALRLEARA